MPPVLTDIDYEHNGKQVSVLRLPFTRNTAGLASVAVPIMVIKNGAGPTILLTAGTHGDEYEGQVALLNLARQLQPEQIRGRLIILPALNYPAAACGRRLSPIDGKDMNRSYPGDAAGTITSSIAYYIEIKLFPMCDAVLDHHGGGYSMDVVPFMGIHDVADGALLERTLQVAEAYGTSIIALWRGLDPGRNLAAAAERHNLLYTCTEIGGGGRLNRQMLDLMESGLRNALRRLGVLEGIPLSRDQRGLPPARLVHTPSAACDFFAPAEGIYEAFHQPGDNVEAGEPAGQIHFVEDPNRTPIVVDFEYSGVLFSTRGPGRVQRGDGLGTVAGDYLHGGSNEN